jgi:hypothetical protein
VPEHWRDTAHFEWSFADPVNLTAERAYGIPMSHCSLAVSRGPAYKFVQFATSSELFPSLLFDLGADPDQVHNLFGADGSGPGSGASRGIAFGAAQELARWYMRTAERTLSGSFLDPQRGLVETRDTWR